MEWSYISIFYWCSVLEVGEWRAACPDHFIPEKRATDNPRQEAAWVRLDTVLKRTLSTLAENQISFLWSAADSLFTTTQWTTKLAYEYGDYGIILFCKLIGPVVKSEWWIWKDANENRCECSILSQRLAERTNENWIFGTPKYGTRLLTA